jgi:hypothetical protein
MGWEAAAPRGMAEAIAEAIVGARAAAAAIAELDGTLPGQPLAVTVRNGSGAARVVPVDAAVVRFAIAGRRHTARVSGEPDELVNLARELARGAGTRDDSAAPAAIAAVVGEHDAGIARHLHRRAWSSDGGPWLGIGRAGGLAVASTCHLVVDGFGHAQIAARVAAAEARDAGLRATLTRAAAQIVGDAPVPAAPPLAGTQPLGVAWRRIARVPRLAELAHALGIVLHAETGGRFSPTMQIPVAPGTKDDLERFARRVVHALVSVRFDERGDAEALEVFRTRMTAAIAREAGEGGLVTRLVRAASRLPVPLAFKRRRLIGARSSFFDGPVEVIAGRASLSLLRMDRAAPLVAVSAPGRVLAPDDPRTSSVVTVIADPDGATITVAGTGGSGTSGGAEALLDRWLRAVRVPAARVA